MTYSAGNAQQAPWQGPQRQASDQWKAWGHSGQEWKRGPSPRRRQPSPRRRGKEPGKGRAKGGKQQPFEQSGKGQVAKDGSQLPMVPTTANMPTAPTPVASQPPKVMAPGISAPTAERQQLDALLQTLQANRGQIPAETLQVLDRLQAEDTQASTRSMHRAVAARASARKELDRIRASRILYLDQWHAYVEKVIATLTKQMSEQATALSELAERETEWAEAYQRAHMELKRLTVVSSAEAIDVDEDERLPWTAARP